MSHLILEEYKPENATHYLRCRHVVGSTSTDYVQKCIPVKSMKNGKTKVVAFGRLFWKETDDVVKVRYVSNFKLIPINEH